VLMMMAIVEIVKAKNEQLHMLLIARLQELRFADFISDVAHRKRVSSTSELLMVSRDFLSSLSLDVVDSMAILKEDVLFFAHSM
jgi:hypothetical protein